MQTKQRLRFITGTARFVIVIIFEYGSLNKIAPIYSLKSAAAEDNNNFYYVVN